MLFFFDNKNIIDVSGKLLFQIPWTIWNILNGNDKKRTVTPAQMEEIYYKVLSESVSKMEVSDSEDAPFPADTIE